MITLKEHSQFLKDSKHFVMTLLSKLFQRIHLGSVIVTYSSIFNPANLVINEIGNSKQKMKKLVNFLVENYIVTKMSIYVYIDILDVYILRCDSAMSQFCDFVNNDVNKNSVEFHNLDKATDRHYLFYFQNLCIKIEKAKELNFVFKLIFTVNHENASVEHEFSVNNLILENSMKAETIIAHCFIKNYMITNELSPHTFEINNDLLLLVKKARGRYQQELQEEKSCKEKNDKKKPSALLQEEIDVVKKKISDIQKSCSMLGEGFLNSMMQADKRMIFRIYIREMH